MGVSSRQMQAKGSIYTDRQLSRQLEALDTKIKDYQDAISAQDQLDDEARLGQLVEDEQLQQKLERLQQKQARARRVITSR